LQLYFFFFTLPLGPDKDLFLVDRSELANDTICSLICAKQNQNMECYEYCPDSEVLKKAKIACKDYNNELKK
jgi:hypothetical protein